MTRLVVPLALITITSVVARSDPLVASASAPRLMCEPIVCVPESLHDDELVCGSDGTVYDSRCAFENAKCREPALELVACSATAHNEKKDKAKCELGCEANWYPICATNGVTYANACRLEEAFCLDHRIGPLHYGECES